MPVARLAERQPRRLVIGTLHKGEKQVIDPATGRSRGFPRDLPGFFRFESRFDDMRESFARTYGQQPTEVLCILDGATCDEAFDAWHEAYVSAPNAPGQLVHRCDGERLVFLRDRGESTAQRWPLERAQGSRHWRATGPPCPFAGMALDERKKTRGACSLRGRLKLLPIELLPNGRPHYKRGLTRIGQIVLVTYSEIDVAYLYDVLNGLEERHDTLQGIPFTLSRELRPTPSRTQDGSPTMVDRWMIALHPDQRWEVLSVEAAYERAVALLEAPDLLALADGDEAPEDGPEEGAPEPDDHPAPPVARAPAPRVDISPAGRTVDAETGEILDDGPQPEEPTPTDDQMDPLVEPGQIEPPPEPVPAPPPRREDDPAHPRPVAGDAATAAQVRAIYMVGRDNLGLDQAAVDKRAFARFGVATVGALTKKQASEMITELKPGAPRPAAGAVRPQGIAGGSPTAVTPSRSNGRPAEQLLATFLSLRARVDQINRAFGLAIPLVSAPPEGADAEKVEEEIRHQLFRSIYALESLAPTTAKTAPATNPTTEEAGRYHASLVAEAAAGRGLDADTLAPVAA